jgi:DNA-directed RNA polymerase specialized sigma subunit
MIDNLEAGQLVSLLVHNKKEIDTCKEQIDNLSQFRSKVIKAAMDKGVSVTDIAKHLKISRQRVYKILKSV